MNNSTKSVRLGLPGYLGAAASGALTAIAFPNLGLMFFAWISLLPLLFLLVKAGPWQGFRLGLTAGTVFYGILLYWIPAVPAHYGGLSAAVSLLVYLLLILALALFWALFGLGFALLRRRLGEAAFFAAPFLWVALEYGITHILTGFPWGLLGLSQYQNISLIQTASVTGVYGVSFLLVLFQSLFAGSITHMKRLPFALGTIALAAVHIAGYLTADKVVPGPDTFKAAVVQGNVSADVDWTREGMDGLLARFDDHMALTRRAREAGAGLDRLAGAVGADVLQLRRRPERPIREHPDRIRLGIGEHPPAGDHRDRGPARCPALLQHRPPARAGRAASKYAKMHLVPFGEYIPYRRLLGFVERMAPDVGGLTPGLGRTLHSFRDIPYASPICYEIVFPDEVRRFVKTGGPFPGHDHQRRLVRALGGPAPALRPGRLPGGGKPALRPAGGHDRNQRHHRPLRTDRRAAAASTSRPC